jgi:phosphatidylethanolamine-binding protein (PEBP) family uncharacterized protein
MLPLALILLLLAPEPAMTMKLTSTVFANEAAIPSRFTCDGTNVSPPLAWSHALDTVLADLDRPTRAKLLAAMKSHLLATTELIGTYQRS